MTSEPPPSHPPMHIGPPPARLDAPPARSEPPPPFRPKLIHFVAVALVFVALALPVYLVATSEAFRNAGLAGFVALFFACLSVVVGVARLVTARRRPFAAGLAALASCLAASGVLSAGLGGHLARASARQIETSDHAMTLGLRLYLVAEAEAGGRTAALLGLTNVVGFGLGFVLLLLVIRARREALPLVPSEAGKNVPPTTPVFVWLFGSTVLFLVGLVVAIWAAALEVRDGYIPIDPAVRRISDAGAAPDDAPLPLQSG
jgi:hypothetical protein